MYQQVRAFLPSFRVVSDPEKNDVLQNGNILAELQFF